MQDLIKFSQPFSEVQTLFIIFSNNKIEAQVNEFAQGHKAYVMGPGYDLMSNSRICFVTANVILLHVTM